MNNGFVHRRQKGILGKNSVALAWNPVAYQHTLTTTYKWGILQKISYKNNLLLLYLTAISFSKKKLYKKQTYLSAHTLGGRKKMPLSP